MNIPVSGTVVDENAQPDSDSFSQKVQYGATDDRSRGITPEEIEALIEERKQARTDKNWARADEIRDELDAKSIVLEDKAGGTIWKVK